MEISRISEWVFKKFIYWLTFLNFVVGFVSLYCAASVGFVVRKEKFVSYFGCIFKLEQINTFHLKRKKMVFS